MLASLPIVQRLYSMFPLGGPGIGLILIRLGLALAILVQYPVLAHLLPRPWLLPSLLVLAMALLLGLITPVLSVAALVLGGLALGDADPFHAWMSILLMLVAMALFLLGPGGYSLDARIYGRRILIMDRDREDGP